MKDFKELIIHKFNKDIIVCPISDVHFGSIGHREKEWNDFCKWVEKTGSFLFGYTTVSVDNKEIHTRAISYTHTTTDTWANADHTHNDDAIYTAIQSLFVYDETTKTLNIIPYGGGS